MKIGKIFAQTTVVLSLGWYGFHKWSQHQQKIKVDLSSLQKKDYFIKNESSDDQIEEVARSIETSQESIKLSVFNATEKQLARLLQACQNGPFIDRLNIHMDFTDEQNLELLQNLVSTKVKTVEIRNNYFTISSVIPMFYSPTLQSLHIYVILGFLTDTTVKTLATAIKKTSLQSLVLSFVDDQNNAVQLSPESEKLLFDAFQTNQTITSIFLSGLLYNQDLTTRIINLISSRKA